MKEFKTSVLLLTLFIVLTGVIYPLAITGIGAVLFSIKVKGSLIRNEKTVIGSKLLGRNYTGARYFHGRPSAADYNPLNSGGSNMGPSNKKLAEEVRRRGEIIRKENRMTADEKIPAELVLASASGLDPHISIAGALLQVPRVAHERMVDKNLITAIIMRNAEKKYFNLMGEMLVNVITLNRELDRIRKQ